MFGIITPAPSDVPTVCGFETEQGAPWGFWDNATYTAMADGYHGTPAGTMGCLGNPDMSDEKGMAMADMMSEFFTPRVYVSLVGPISDIGITEELAEKVNIYPNPANNFITINANNNTISSVKLYSVEGKLLRSHTTNQTSVIIEKNELTNGLYFIELEVNKQTIKKSVVFN